MNEWFNNNMLKQHSKVHSSTTAAHTFGAWLGTLVVFSSPEVMTWKSIILLYQTVRCFVEGSSTKGFYDFECFKPLIHFSCLKKPMKSSTGKSHFHNIFNGGNELSIEQNLIRKSIDHLKENVHVNIV